MNKVGVIIDILIFWSGIHQVLYLVYLLQLKEYRWDRMWDFLRQEWEKAAISQFDLRRWYRPQRTARAILTTFLACSLFGFIFYSSGDGFYKFFSLVINPLLVAGVWLISDPLFAILKQRAINKAKKKMLRFRGEVIGITGSYGKSSTKELLTWVLAGKYKVLSTPKNVNSEIGVAQTVLKDLRGDEDVFVVEMGAYKIGEIKAICDIVKPRYGIITGLGDQHLSLFGSLENIKKGKYELIESLPEEGWGTVAEKDFKLSDAKEIKVEKDKIAFNFEGENYEVKILGGELVRNVVGVIMMAKKLGMNSSEIKERLKNFEANSIYPKLIRVGKDKAIIDDSYNSSLDSFLSLITYADTWQEWKKVLVTPGIIELGDNTAKDHLMIAELSGVFDKIYITNKKIAKYFNNKGVVVEPNLEKLKIRLKDEFDGNTVVMFKGRVPYAIIESLK